MKVFAFGFLSLAFYSHAAPSAKQDQPVPGITKQEVSEMEKNCHLFTDNTNEEIVPEFPHEASKWIVTNLGLALNGQMKEITGNITLSFDSDVTQFLSGFKTCLYEKEVRIDYALKLLDCKYDYNTLLDVLSQVPDKNTIMTLENNGMPGAFAKQALDDIVQGCFLETGIEKNSTTYKTANVVYNKAWSVMTDINSRFEDQSKSKYFESSESAIVMGSVIEMGKDTNTTTN